MQNRVIDMWAPIVPSREIMAYVAEHYPEPQLGYLRVFFKTEPSAEGFRTLALAMAQDDAEIIHALDHAGIDKCLITGFDETTSSGMAFVSNDCIAPIVDRHPERFIPFAGVDIFKGAAAVAEFEHWVRERGFRGLSLRPFMIGLPADDQRYYPFYEKCVELDVPISMHASANWTTCRPSELGHPRHFDQVACDFPDLKLILSHAGYPWVLEACLLAWKHPNLYLELAAHRPKYFTAPGAGWEPLLRYGTTTIQDKILYGTGAFLIGMSPADLIGELRDLQMSARVMEKWLYGNGARLLGISPT